MCNEKIIYTGYVSPIWGPHLHQLNHQDFSFRLRYSLNPYIHSLGFGSLKNKMNLEKILKGHTHRDFYNGKTYTTCFIRLNEGPEIHQIDRQDFSFRLSSLLNPYVSSLWFGRPNNKMNFIILLKWEQSVTFTAEILWPN